jgi:hypothetical protein
MIERISLALVDESGETIVIKERQIETKIETAIADIFSEICRRNNEIADAEIKIAEKFHFAAALKNYLKEQKENGDRSTN